MKSKFPFLTLVLLITFGLGTWGGCSVGFDPGEIDYCEEDGDCVEVGEECNTSTNTCERPESENGNGDPDVCDPEELGDDYPLEEPLDGVQEVCDGQDNTCDGHVDRIFCESSSDCPPDPEDIYGTSLRYRCDDHEDHDELERSECRAYFTDTLDCPRPFGCVGEEEAYESVFEDCGRGNPPPDDDGNGNGDGDEGNDSNDG